MLNEGIGIVRRGCRAALLCSRYRNSRGREGSPVAQPIARVTRRMMGLIFIAAVLATDMPASPAGLFPHREINFLV